MDQELKRRYKQLFRFYDIQGDGVLELKKDFEPVAHAVSERWKDRKAPFPNLLSLLMETYRHELERRDLNHNGKIDEDEFIRSHETVIRAFRNTRMQAELFVARSAGGFFDCLDLDRDGFLDLSDLEAYAEAYHKPVNGIKRNLQRILAAFDMAPDRLPRDIFLILVKQYWFDPSPDVPGRWLFCLDPGEDT